MLRKSSLLFFALIFFAKAALFSVEPDFTSAWMSEQIQEDLSPTACHSINKSQLRAYFYELGKTYQVLYCRIRKNKLSWETSTYRNDDNRNNAIFNYFSELRKQYPLPDTEFILCTEDGFHQNSKYPLFAFASYKPAKQNVCLFPDFEALQGMEGIIDNFLRHSSSHSWNSKRGRIFFRGASTGRNNADEDFFGNDRLRAVAFSAHYPDILEADFHMIFDANIHNFVHQIGKSIQPNMSIEDHFRYKFLLDIDGNSSTYSRGRWILLSNSTLLKMSSDYVQWYYKNLSPYVNYIPVSQNLADLTDIFAWLRNNDDQAYVIAINGQNLAKELFSRKATDEYVVQLLREYSSKLVLGK